VKKFLVRALLLAGLLLVLIGITVWRAMMPPAPLQALATTFMLHDVTIINPGASRAERQSLTVRGGVIQNITASAAIADREALRNYSGMFVLPGLADMHAHLPPDNPLRLTSYFLLLNLAHGVTSIRDAGDLDGTSIKAQRDATRDGYPGPRVFACGPFVSAGERKWANTVLLKTPDDAEPVVAKLKVDGFHCIKAYDGLTLPMVNELRRAADKHGMKLIGHVPELLSYEQALVPDTQHLMGVAAPAATSTIPDHRLPLVRGWGQVDDDRMRAIVAITRQAGIANTPTLVYEQQLLKLEAYALSKDSPDARLLPRLYRDVVWHPDTGIPAYRGMTAEDFARVRIAHAKKMQLVRQLYETGMPLYLGTDVQQPFISPGISLHQEMRLVEKSGVPPAAIWEMATNRAARSLGVAQLGSIMSGAPADFLIFREDPSQNLNALETLEAVVAQGRLYSKADIDAKVAEYRVHYEGIIFDRLSVGLAKAALRSTAADAH
jgi:imidazolonepropionase-like amidohydrolase